MRAVLSALTPEQVIAKSHAACKELIRLEEFRAARSVMLYVSMSEEVETLPIALAAWQHEKTVLAPKVDIRQRHMIPLEIRSLDSELVTGPYGIREPHYAEPWPLEEIDFVVVPALAFDRSGNRLGRGAGFYDRFFASPLLKAFRCGLSFAEQLVDEVPTSPNDRPIHALATDKEVLRFNHPPHA